MFVIINRTNRTGILALAYALIPFDIIPDATPIIGFIDDLLVYLWALCLLLLRYWAIKNR